MPIYLPRLTLQRMIVRTQRPKLYLNCPWEIRPGNCKCYSLMILGTIFLRKLKTFLVTFTLIYGKSLWFIVAQNSTVVVKLENVWFLWHFYRSWQSSWFIGPQNYPTVVKTGEPFFATLIWIYGTIHPLNGAKNKITEYIEILLHSIAWSISRLNE